MPIEMISTLPMAAAAVSLPWTAGLVLLLGIVAGGWGWVRHRAAKKAGPQQDPGEPAAPAQQVRIAGMLRELGPSLQAVLLYAELIQDHAREAGDRDLLGDSAGLQAAAQLLAAHVNLLQDLSVLEGGVSLDLNLERVPLEPLCQEVERLAYPVAALRNHSIEMDLPPFLRSLRTDRVRLIHLLLCLMAHAAQQGEGDALCLEVIQGAHTTRFLVRRTGGMRALVSGSKAKTPNHLDLTPSLEASLRIAQHVGGNLKFLPDEDAHLLEIPNETKAEAHPVGGVAASV